MKWVFILLLLIVIFQSGKSDEKCPYPSEITPCVCNDQPSAPNIICQNITDPEDLRKAFINSASFHFIEVHIQDSRLQFLPHELVEGPLFGRLFLKNVTLDEVFDRTPETAIDLIQLHVEHLALNSSSNSSIWEIVAPFKRLKLLTIYNFSIETLGNNLISSASNSLQQITLYQTNTTIIESGTFAKFKKLTKVACDNSNLTELTRNIFPTPFLGSQLYFNDNKISTISEDLFVQMPNLQTLGLRNNLLATLPESAFVGVGSNLEYLFLEGNPFKCDCRIVWLIEKRPRIPMLTGACSRPKALHGMKLKDLTRDILHC